MFKKVILFFLMGFALLQANSLDKCDNTAVVSNLKEKIPSEIFKNLYELSGLKAQGIDYEDYAKGLKEIAKHDGMVNYTDMIEINSISNFDSCMATINAALKGEQRKGLWSVVYKVSNINQVKITDITYINGDFQ
ncbi:hypothetical protein FW818_01930 [Campylobacter jejuni]|nr:hypothetical protein [Campylobacter jejuni]HEC1838302.1 hypothetical protein [Campylobacter jejuni]